MKLNIFTTTFLFVGLFSLAKLEDYQECSTSGMKTIYIDRNNTYKSISYRTDNVENCSWSFALRDSNAEFLLILDLYYFDARSKDNFMVLPNGKKLNNSEDVTYREPKSCQIYGRSEKRWQNDTCLQKILRLYCSANDVIPLNTWPPRLETVQMNNQNKQDTLRFGLFYRIIPYSIEDIITDTIIGCLKTESNCCVIDDTDDVNKNDDDAKDDDNDDDAKDDDNDDDDGNTDNDDDKCQKQTQELPQKQQNQQSTIIVITTLAVLLGVAVLALIIALIKIKKLKKSLSSCSTQKNQTPISNNAERMKSNYEEISYADISKPQSEKQMVDNIIYHSS